MTPDVRILEESDEPAAAFMITTDLEVDAVRRSPVAPLCQQARCCDTRCLPRPVETGNLFDALDDEVDEMARGFYSDVDLDKCWREVVETKWPPGFDGTLTGGEDEGDCCRWQYSVMRKVCRARVLAAYNEEVQRSLEFF